MRISLESAPLPFPSLPAGRQVPQRERENVSPPLAAGNHPMDRFYLADAKNIVAPARVEKKENSVKTYLDKIVARGADGYRYFSDASMVDFEEEMLIPWAREGKLKELLDGLKDFYEVAARHLDHEWEKNYYALFVLKEFLALSLEKSPDGRYSRAEMEEKLVHVFYTDGIGEKPAVMNKTKLGINLYLRVLIESKDKVAAPDDSLLDYLSEIGCRRPWIAALRKKLGGVEKQ